MAPTLAPTPGAKGHRPVVGTWDCKHLVRVFAVANVATAAVRANLADSPKDAQKRAGPGKTRRLQAAFAARLRHAGRMYPAAAHPRVVVPIDNAPWHTGDPARRALAENPHLELKRLPAYSPPLDPVGRFWRVLRRRATHDRLLDSTSDLRRSLRDSPSYFQTVRDRVRSPLAGRQPKRTASPGS
jgi:transposase